jgi:signal transduction histidine kinase
VTDLDGRIVLSNSRAAELIGAAASTLVGTSLQHLLEQIGVSDATFPALLARDSTTAPAVRQFEGHSHGGRDLLVSIANCHGAGEGVIGYIVNLTDVSDLKAAGKAREDAMRFLSHDLRAPQAAILTAVELRRSAPEILTEEALLGQIERSARRTLGLAEAFVTMTRADHVDRHSFTPVDLADLAREMADETWPVARAKATHVEQEIADHDALVLGDRRLLGAAILNLLGNAIKYAPGGTQVTIALRRHGHTWVISVRDQGPGIPVEAQQAIFQRYRRLGIGARQTSDGAGLGLVIVETVARRHGGGVQVESRPGEGSTFSIWLPMHEPGPNTQAHAGH